MMPARVSNLYVIPAQAGIHASLDSRYGRVLRSSGSDSAHCYENHPLKLAWIPAFAGMTGCAQ